jgi:hypothetical protein
MENYIVKTIIIKNSIQSEDFIMNFRINNMLFYQIKFYKKIDDSSKILELITVMENIFFNKNINYSIIIDTIEINIEKNIIKFINKNIHTSILYLKINESLIDGFRELNEWINPMLSI